MGRCAGREGQPTLRIRRSSRGKTNDHSALECESRARLEALRSGRVATAEVLVRDALSGSVETKDGAIDVVTARGERGLGVRVLDGQRIGFAHTSDLALAGIEACVDQARRMATITEPDEDLRIANAPLDKVELDIYQPGLEVPALATRSSALAGEASGAVRDRAHPLRKTSSAMRGHAGMPPRSLPRFVPRELLRADDERGRDAGCDRQSDPTASSRTTADSTESRRSRGTRALDKLGAKPFPTPKLPVVLDPGCRFRSSGAISPLCRPTTSALPVLFAGKVGDRVRTSA